jgi:hypothetical protein
MKRRATLLQNICNPNDIYQLLGLFLLNSKVDISISRKRVVHVSLSN